MDLNAALESISKIKTSDFDIELDLPNIAQESGAILNNIETWFLELSKKQGDALNEEEPLITLSKMTLSLPALFYVTTKIASKIEILLKTTESMIKLGRADKILFKMGFQKITSELRESIIHTSKIVKELRTQLAQSRSLARSIEMAMEANLSAEVNVRKGSNYLGS